MRRERSAFPVALTTGVVTAGLYFAAVIENSLKGLRYVLAGLVVAGLGTLTAGFLGSKWKHAFIEAAALPALVIIVGLIFKDDIDDRGGYIGGFITLMIVIAVCGAIGVGARKSRTGAIEEGTNSGPDA